MSGTTSTEATLDVVVAAPFARNPIVVVPGVEKTQSGTHQAGVAFEIALVRLRFLARVKGHDRGSVCERDWRMRAVACELYRTGDWLFVGDHIREARDRAHILRP